MWIPGSTRSMNLTGRVSSWIENTINIIWSLQKGLTQCNKKDNWQPDLTKLNQSCTWDEDCPFPLVPLPCLVPLSLEEPPGPEEYCGQVLLLWPKSLQMQHLNVVDLLLWDVGGGSFGSLRLFFLGLPGILVIKGGKIGSCSTTGHVTSSGIGLIFSEYVLR